MNEKKQSGETKKYWSKVRDFNLSRTNIWILLSWQLLETVFPFLIVWLLLSPDFESLSFNYYLFLDTQAIPVFATVSVGLIVWGFLSNLILFLVRGQKADSFTFTISLTVVFFLILINSLWQNQWAARLDLKIFIRFLICLFGLVPGMFIGLIVTSLFRNWTYRIEEDQQAMLEAYRNGKEVPTKTRLKLERILKHRQKQELEAIQLAQFRQELDGRLSSAYEQNREKYLAREAKLDAKENKKRLKDQQKKQKHH